MDTLICKVNSLGEMVMCEVEIPDSNIKVKHPPRELNPAYKNLSKEVESKVNKIKQLIKRNAELEKNLLTEERYKMRNYVPTILNWFNVGSSEKDYSEKDYEELCVKERWFIQSKGINH